MRTILSRAVRQFYPTGQITSHDSEDSPRPLLVDLGYTAPGSRDHEQVRLTRTWQCSSATQGNPYGGYSGGYKHCATGISPGGASLPTTCPR